MGKIKFTEAPKSNCHPGPPATGWHGTCGRSAGDLFPEQWGIEMTETQGRGLPGVANEWHHAALAMHGCVRGRGRTDGRGVHVQYCTGLYDGRHCWVPGKWDAEMHATKVKGQPRRGNCLRSGGDITHLQQEPRRLVTWRGYIRWY